MLLRSLFAIVICLFWSLPALAQTSLLPGEGQSRPSRPAAEGQSRPAPEAPAAEAPTPEKPADTGFSEDASLGVEDAGPDEESTPAPRQQPASTPAAAQPAPAPAPEPARTAPAAYAGDDEEDGESLPALETGQVVIRNRAGSELAPSIGGLSGIFRTITARTGSQHTMMFGSHVGGYYLSDSWDSADHSHLEARGHLAYSVLDDLEVHADLLATGHRATFSNGNEPEFMQTLGDFTFGAKYVYPIYDYLAVGGALDVRFYTKVRSIGSRWGSFSLMPLGMVSFDAREHPEIQWPLVAHANIGFFFDQGYKALLTGDNSDLAFNADLTASRLNGMNVAVGDQFLMRVGLEFPQEDYTVFLEYSTEQEVNNRLLNGVEKEGWGSSPQRLTPGVRWNFIDRLVMDAAVDIGLGGEYVADGKAANANPGYQFWLGLAYSHDPRAQKVVDTRGFVKGIVVDAETGEPLGGAVVRYEGMPVSRQVTSEDGGMFQSFPLLPGQAKIRIELDSYEPVVVSPNIIGQEVVTEKILLRKIDEGGQLVGALVGSVLDPMARPVPASLSFVDVDIAGTRANPMDGSFVKILPPGQYKVRVEAEGFQPKIFLVPVEARRKTRVVFELPPEGVDTTSGAIAGTLVDPDGKPVGGTIRFPEGEARDIVANAETGEFYASLPPGRYKIEVGAPGFSSRAYLIPVETGKKTRVDIKMVPVRSVGAIEGRLLTADGKPLSGTVRFRDTAHGTLVLDPATGGFYKVLPPGTYDVEFDSPGLGKKAAQFQVLDGKKTVQDFRYGEDQSSSLLARLTANGIEIARAVSFEKGSTDIDAGAREVLDAIAEVLKANPEVRVSVVAYTDDQGPARSNLRETQAQAEAVIEYLVSRGIDRTRLRPVGAGQENPLAPNTTAEGRAQNRRVEFRVR